ncbi:MAG: SAM hydrolase/SAM-dependent halogenase family protein [Myxococcota bacterium]
MFRPNGFLTLTSDFGGRDGYVGEMKGVVICIASRLSLIDIAHDLPAQDVAHAARVIASAAPRFPAGTVHVVVVDPGVGTERAAIVLSSGGHVFVGPDNGLFGPVAERLGGVDSCHRITEHAYLRPSTSTTFDGRDVFAPTGAALAADLLACEATGIPWTPTLECLPKVQAGDDGARLGEVVTLDHFGNALTNLRRADLPAGPVAVEVGGVTLPISRTYGEVSPGVALALIGSDGWLEIAVRNGSAQAHLKLRPGSPVRVLSVPVR